MMQPTHRRTEVTEREKLDQIGHAMMLAWQRVKRTQARMWGDWMTIGEGLLEGRRWAMQMAGIPLGANRRPEGKAYVMAFSEWLRRYRVDDMDKSDRAKLLQLMEDRAGVEEWRATLTDYERRNLNNPTIAWRKWTAATRVKKPKPRSASVSATEMGEQQQARIEELEEELANTEFKPTGTADEIAAQLIGMFGAKAESIARAVLARLKTARPEAAVEEVDDDAAEERTSAGGLEWTGDDDNGYLARGLVEGIRGQLPIAYTVVPVIFRGCEHFEAKIVTDPDPDFTLPVKQLADRHGMSLTRDVKGRRRTVDPVPTAAEAKEMCEIAFTQQ
jgi:hypothetical protein